MTDYKLTEEDKKRLTPFLGECYWLPKNEDERLSRQRCKTCKKEEFYHKYRLCTFTTPSDQHAVFKKLVEVRKWDGFYKFFLKKANFIIPAIVGYDCVSAEVKWLFINPARFCKLVADYLDENKS